MPRISTSPASLLRTASALVLLTHAPLAGGGAPEKPLFDQQAYDQPDTDYVLCADWNGDGRDDVAAASEVFGGGVSLYLADEMGVLQRQPDVLLDFRPSGLAAADADGDGDLDLVATSAINDAVAVVLGQGDGSFGVPLEIEVPGGPQRVVADDLDGDGDLDIVTANTVDWSLTVLQGLAGGGFSPPVALQLFSDPADLAVADFDGNGLLDVVSVTRQGWIYLALGEHGFFDISVPHTTGEEFLEVEVGDFDGDGDADVAALSGRLFILDGAGDGTLAAPLLHGWGNPFHLVLTNGRSLRARDVTGDGIDDLAVGHNSLILLLNGLQGGNFEPVEEVVTGHSFTSLDFGDLDGDGGLDLVFGHDSFNGDLDVVRRGASGRLTPDPSGPAIAAITAIDLDGDGREDLGSVGPHAFLANAQIQMQRQQEDGTFVVLQEFEVSGFVQSSAFGDVDADGDQDLLLVVGQGSQSFLRLLRNPGDGVFPTEPETLATAISSLNDAAFIEINGDGFPDVVVGRDGVQQIYAFENVGGASFGPPVVLNTGPDPRKLAIGDLDGDGWDDIVADSSDHSIFVRLADGNGSFEPVIETEGADTFDHPVLGDFDGDGHLDCVVRTTRLVFLFGVGDGTFTEGPGVPFLQPWEPVLVADMDGDGVDDVVLPGTQIIFGRADRDLQPPTHYPEPTSLVVVGLAIDDVDRDGRPDVIQSLAVNSVPEPAVPGVYVALNRAPDPASLLGEPGAVSLSAGGTQSYTLCAGEDRGGQAYLLLGTFTGTEPGLGLGTESLPLNPDAYFLLTLGNPGATFLEGSVGVLDELGVAAAANVVPPATNPALAGLELHHAFLTVDLGAGAIDFASAAAPLDLVP